MKASIPRLAALALALATSLAASTASAVSPAGASWLAVWYQANPVWRGTHVMLSDDAHAEALVTQLPRLAAAGVNAVIVEVDYNFEFQASPELRGHNVVSRKEARRLTDTARQNGIRLIPQLSCLGHQSWSHNTFALLTKHPELDETPGKFPNNDGIYCRSWCPSNPKVNRVVFPLIDEMIEAFDADAFHVGMDEVFIIGSEFCPRCHGKDPAKLFAKAVNDLHKHLVGKKHVEMLMWADRLLNAKETGYGKWEAAANGTERAIELIPQDIIMCDWHYEKRAVYPSVPLLLAKGFRVWPCGWKSAEAADAFIDFSLQSHSPRMVGYMATTWGSVALPKLADWPPLVEGMKHISN